MTASNFREHCACSSPVQYCRMQNRVVVLRRRIGAICTCLGLILFSSACFIYLRYVSDPANLHAQERVQHARELGALWTGSFYGALFLFFLSLSGLGWGRWAGLVVNIGAVLCALMTLGAMCGPFGC